MKLFQLFICTLFCTLLTTSVYSQVDSTRWESNEIKPANNKKTQSLKSKEDLLAIMPNKWDRMKYINSKEAIFSSLNDSINKKTIVLVPGLNAFPKFDLLEIKKGEIISNVIRVYNNSNTTKTFKAIAQVPGHWQSIGRNRLYTVQPNDTIFVAIRVAPKGILNGNTKYEIGVVLNSPKGIPIYRTGFYVFSRKVKEWSVSVFPNDFFYLRNNENLMNFDLHLDNDGNFPQDVSISFQSPRKNVLLLDSLGNIEKKLIFDYKIDSKSSNYHSFSTSIQEDGRNENRISLLSYEPTKSEFEKKYHLIINAIDPTDKSKSQTKKTKRIEIRRLANEKRILNYNNKEVPLMFESNVQNIIGDNVYMSFIINGIKSLTENSGIDYSTSINFTQNNWNSNLLNQLPWRAYYYRPEGKIWLGNTSSPNISGGEPAINGKGIRTEYNINLENKVGIYAISKPGLRFGPRSDQSTIGGYHIFKGKNRFFSKTNFLTLTNNRSGGRSENYFGNRTYFKVKKIVSVNVNFSTKYIRNVEDRITPFQIGVSQTGVYAKGRVSQMNSIRFISSKYSSNNRESIYLRNGTTVRITPKYGMVMNSTYSNRVLFQENVFYNNLLINSFLTPKLEMGNAKVNIPSIFYFYSNSFSGVLQSRGINYTNSILNSDKNFLLSLNFRAGYLKINFHDELSLGDYFTLSHSTVMKLKTLSLNLSYSYGTINFQNLESVLASNKTPQYFRGSINNQYTFKNNKFVMENSLNYSYDNMNQKSSTGALTEFFIFTKKQFRFGLRASYFQSKKSNQLNLLSQNGFDFNFGDNLDEPIVSRGISFGVSARKSFNVKLPFISENTANISFKTFYDLNGNRVFDKDEIPIENVIIRLNRHEVISDKIGESMMKNIIHGKYMFTSFSLDDQKSWFPVVDDSINVIQSEIIHIPFAKGIKIIGEVIVEQEKIGSNMDRVLDLSNIKIVAYDGKRNYYALTDSKGKYEMFVPSGKYEISMDQRILGSSLKLTRNYLELDLTNDIESIYTSFYIVQKKREIRRKKLKGKKLIPKSQRK